MNRWHLGVQVLMGSALWTFWWILSGAQPVAAQIVPDNTLPAGERSQVSGDPNFQIDGGAQRGTSLFHSFSQFSVPTAGSASFNNAADVQNIFSRVTGASASNIDGLLRANSTANLFLLNPNGILFGPNASLDTGGSFVTTTANAIGFPDGEVFSSDTTQPLPNQLLTVEPNALFFSQLTPQPITNQSTFNDTGLQVPLRQNLLLVGGAVQLDGGQMISPGSHVELGGMGAVGTVGLSTTGEDWELDMPDGVLKADVSLSNGSDIDVTGDSGNIRIFAQNIDISGSELQIGIPSDSSLLNAQAGDMELNATRSIAISDLSALSNILSAQGTVGSVNLTAGDRISLDYSTVESSVNQTGNGDADGINITTGSLFLTNSGQLFSSMSGRGNAGSVTIDAPIIVSIDGFNGDYNSAIYSYVDTDSTGNAGDINITAGSFSLLDSALLVSYTAGQGDAGNVAITADSLSVTNGGQLNTLTIGQGRASNVNVVVQGTASFDGVDSFGTPSSILTGVDQSAVGSGGGGILSLTAGSLSLTNGATLNAITFGLGNAGTINLTVRGGVLIEDSSTGGTGIFTTVGEGGVGNGGTINLRAGSLSLVGDAAIAADTNGEGQGGNINLDVEGTLLISGGGRAAPTGESSRITLGVQPGGNASGGDLRIRAGSLILQNGGLVKASTQGQGDAGNLDIGADVIDISGSNPTNGLPSGLFTSSDTVGNAGDITLNTQSFRIADGAALSARSRDDGQGGDITVNAARAFEAVDGGQLITTTFGQGRAGNIAVNAGEQVTIAGNDPNYADRLARFPNPVDPLVANAITETGSASGLFADTRPNSAGRGGDIQITTGRLTVQAGAQLITSTSGNERAGDITVNAQNVELSGAASGLFAQTTTAADAGDLTIQPRGEDQNVRVNVQDGAQISASTSGSGQGGQLTITAPESITLTGNGSIITAGTEGSGEGGDLALQTDTLDIQNQAEVTVSSSRTGRAGSLFVDANRIYLNHQGSIRADTTGGGGDIDLRSPQILLRNGSNITTDASGGNIPGGNVAIATQFLIAVPTENSDISANSENFRGGNVNVNALATFGIQPRPAPTSLSDITATGASSALNGAIAITPPRTDPTSGLVELPTNLVDASQQIAQGCPANQGNSFVASGRGGLPPTPEQQLDDDAGWQDRRRLSAEVQPDTAQQTTDSQRRSPPSTSPLNPSLIEATGWQTTPTGAIKLIASSANSAPLNQSVACQGNQ